MRTTLTEIADKIYFDGNDITRKDINYVINNCFYYIAQELLAGKGVMVTNFGRFKRTKRNSISFTPADRIRNEIKQQKQENCK